jgi:hypothetical protein
MAGTAQRIIASGGDVLVPGTNFCISNRYLRITLTGQEASLAAGDYMDITQAVEGPQIRELFYDVSSVSLLVRSSVAGLNFGFYLKDPTGANTLTKLCTIPTANTWTLISLANLPVFPGAGTWTTNTGVIGAIIGICLGSGVTYASPANNVFQSGSFLSATGQSNFASSPVNSTFDIAFVQHEPGPVCTTLMDKPFTQNYDECLRYFAKSYNYAVAVATITSQGKNSFIVPVGFTSNPVGHLTFPKPMAKTPTCTVYSDVNAAVNSCRDNNGAIDRTVNSVVNSEKVLNQLGTTTANTAGGFVTFHYTADTGW